MTAPGPKSASPQFRADIARWHAREHDILSGKAIPTAQDRKRGHSAFEGSPLLDLRQAIDVEISRDQVSAEALAALEICRAVPTAENCWSVYQNLGGHGDVEQVYLWHAAIRGHEQAVPMLAIATMQSRSPHDRVGWMMSMALAFGLMSNFGVFHPDDGLEAEDLAECRSAGTAKMRLFGTLADEFDADVEESEWEGQHQEKPVKAVTGLEAVLAEFAAAGKVADMLEDRAEVVRDEIPSFDPPPAGRIVVPQVLLLRPDSKHRTEILAGVKPIAGKVLPFAGVDRLADARTALLAALPHLHAEIDRILGSQVGRPFPLFRLLLVGEAGAGKTTMAMLLGSVFGMPSLVFNAGGAADAAFGGTSSQYASQRMSVPLQLTAQSGIANGLVAVDEVDKIGTGRQNGSIVDVLLAFLEPSSSARYQDPALETSVDLSAMSYVLTANSLEDVPVPLRDRVQIVRIPEPGWEHVGALTARIIADLARERGLDPRWIPPLDPDELDVLKTGWNGGSLRQLTKLTRLMIDGREAFFGRA